MRGQQRRDDVQREMDLPDPDAGQPRGDGVVADREEQPADSRCSAGPTMISAASGMNRNRLFGRNSSVVPEPSQSTSVGMSVPAWTTTSW